MIAFLEEARREDWLALCRREPVIGVRMQSMLGMYGADSGIADFWVALSPLEEPVVALMRFDGWMVIAGRSAQMDWQEIGSFLQSVGGFGYVESTPEICRELAGYLPGKHSGSLTMRFTGTPPAEADPAIDAVPSLEAVHQIICAADKTMASLSNWEVWYPHTSHVVRHGLGFTALLRENGVPVATGGVYAHDGRRGVIGSVATLPEHRGKGYGARIVRHLCGECISRGLEPVLYCAGDSLAQFYTPLGFEPLGCWEQISLLQDT